MPKIDNTGPAFPCEVSYHDDGTLHGKQTGNTTGIDTGVSIRVYLAAKAMQAIISKLPVWAAGRECPFGLPDDWKIEHEINTRVALGAFRYADAMIELMEKP